MLHGTLPNGYGIVAIGELAIVTAAVTTIGAWIKGLSLPSFILVVLVCSAIAYIAIGLFCSWISKRQKIVSQTNSKEKTDDQNLAGSQESLLTIDAVRCENCTGGILRYYCQLRVYNKTPIATENVEVKLMAWEPLPSNPYSTASGLPMPVVFPISLKSEVEGGNLINPGDHVCFRIFNMIRAGNVPTVEIIGKESKFCWFQPQKKWYTFEVHGSSQKGSICKQRFQLTFLPGSQDIPAFEVRQFVSIS